MTQPERIFISIASYCDPMLQFTVNDAWLKAKQPDRLRFGIVDQSPPEQRQVLPNEFARRHIRYVHVHPSDTRGVCWARSLAMTLYQGEEWFFQIDSHMLFEPGWDERLIAQTRECQAINPRCIVSSYPNPFEMVNGAAIPKPTTDKVLAHIVKPDSQFENDHPTLSFQAIAVDQDAPVRGFHLGAGCLFAPGDFVSVLPYDPHLYFHGEEQSLAVRAFTHGWDIFHVSGLPVYHLYNVGDNAKNRPLHWSEDEDKQRQQRWWELDAAAKTRLRRLVFDGADLGIHGLGRERSLADYARFSGINYIDRRIDEPARSGPWAVAATAGAAPTAAPANAVDHKAVFTHIFKANAWGDGESASGPGSTTQATQHVRRELPGLLAELGVRAMLDLPCGDFNWMRHVDLAGIDYLGGDLVAELVAENNRRHARANVRFAVLDLLNDDLPRVDLVMCRDCLFHFPLASVQQALQNIQRSGARWLLTTSFTWRQAGPNTDIPMGGWHRLNLELPPISLPRPARVLVEGCGIPGAEDKSLLLFDLDELR